MSNLRQIYPNTCQTEDVAKEKAFFEEKIYMGHALCGPTKGMTHVSSGKNDSKIFFLYFSCFSCLNFVFILNH